MDLERRLDIETSEGVPISLTMAGLGSRILAGTVDAAISIGVLILMVMSLGLAGSISGGVMDVAAALMGAGVLILFIGVPIAFETLVNGRTVGKMAVGLRVVMNDGSPVTLWPSTVRNLARLVDLLPAFYAAGLLSMLVTSREQRLGDLMAGTIVVRDRIRRPARGGAYPIPAGPPWDVRMVTDEEIALVTRFLDRSDQLQPAARRQLADSLSASIRPKVTGAPSTIDAELLLRGVVAHHRAGKG